MADRTELFEIIHTTRAMRRLKPDTVPDALINRILEAGQCAPNGANAQQWRFLVITEPATQSSRQRSCFRRMTYFLGVPGIVLGYPWTPFEGHKIVAE